MVLLEGDGALLHLGNDKFLERVQAYLDLSSTLRNSVADIDYVDLRFDQRVYVRPAAADPRAGRSRDQRQPATRQF